MLYLYIVMSIEEIFESEERNEENLYDIHFYMEGSFWRAYEWSAYLSRMFPSDLKEEERLKVLKKLPKGYDDGYVLVGLQLSSFEKYFPNVADDEEIFEMLDKHIVIHARKYFLNKDFSDYEGILSKWKKFIEASKKEKKKSKFNNAEIESEFSFENLIQEIVSYPIENKSLIESIAFLSYVRDKAFKIIKQNKMNS